MSEWINIKDQLPPRPGSYLVVVLDWNIFQEPIRQIKMLRVGKWTRDFGLSGVTHWMPLPELPKEENK